MSSAAPCGSRRARSGAGRARSSPAVCGRARGPRHEPGRMSVETPHRPVLLGVLAILVGIQGVLRSSPGSRCSSSATTQSHRHLDHSSGNLGAVGIVVLVIGVIEFRGHGALAGQRLRPHAGHDRGLPAVHRGALTFIFYAGTWRWQGLWQTLFAAFVLWLLFNRGAERYFRETH